jgi:hypothetical protein
MKKALSLRRLSYNFELGKFLRAFVIVAEDPTLEVMFLGSR